MSEEHHPPLENLSDAEYIAGIASYYGNSHREQLGHHHARLLAIAKRLDRLDSRKGKVHGQPGTTA